MSFVWEYFSEEQREKGEPLARGQTDFYPPLPTRDRRMAPDKDSRFPGLTPGRRQSPFARPVIVLFPLPPHLSLRPTSLSEPEA